MINNFCYNMVFVFLKNRHIKYINIGGMPGMQRSGNHGQIAQLSTTTMSDGTKMQNVCFGKILKV